MANPLSEDLEFILDRSESRLRRLAGERIFLTGGTGFFGRWLLETLTWANDRLKLDLRITVLSRDPTAFARQAPHLGNHATVDWCHGDVRSFISPDGHFAFVIHAATAASLPLSQAEPLMTFDTIVNGTKRVLEFADHSDCQAFLLTSSGAVYGPQPADLSHLPEDYMGAPSPNLPTSAYGEGKRAAELLCAVSGLPTKIARGFAFVGPFLPMNGHFAVGNFLRDAAINGTIEVKGDGKSIRSYLYAADLVVWLLAILCDGRTNRPYNVGSDKAISIGDLAHKVAQCAGDCKVKISGAKNHEPPQQYLPSIERARTDLGLEVWTSLEDALPRTLRHARLIAELNA